MKEVIDFNYQVSWDGLNWFDLGILRNIKCCEKINELEQVLKCETWKQLEYLVGINWGEGLLEKQSFNRICFMTSSCNNYSYWEKTFKYHSPLYFRCEEKILNPSVSWLLKNLSLEEFQEYCDNRKISCLTIR